MVRDMSCSVRPSFRPSVISTLGPPLGPLGLGEIELDNPAKKRYRDCVIIKTYLANKNPVTFEDFTEALVDNDRLILQSLIGKQLCCLMLHVFSHAAIARSHAFTLTSYFIC